MRRYLTSWAIATFVVSPLVLFLVPVAHRLVASLPGPHASDSVWTDFLSMVGFYGAYALLASAAGSSIYTWLLGRVQPGNRTAELGLGAAVGIIVLLPQGIAFGTDYVLINILIGAAAGALFAMLMGFMPLPAKRAPAGGEQTT